MCHRHHTKVVFKVCCKRRQAIPPAQRLTTTRTTTTPRPVVQQKHLPSVNFSSNRVPAASQPDTKVKYPWYHSMGPNLITTPRPVPTRPTTFQSTTAQTPYWWRPHFTKLPFIKSERGTADQGYSIKKKGNVKFSLNFLSFSFLLNTLCLEKIKQGKKY